MAESIDPVAVAVALITLLIGPKLATYVGPYVVIAAAGLTGAAFSLGRRNPEAKLGPLAFLSIMVLFSMLLTVGLTQALAMLWHPFGSSWMLAPVALVVGYVGDDWPDLMRWLASRAGRLLERRAGVDDRSPGGQ